MPAILNPDLMTVTSLTERINELEYLPNQIESLGLFYSYGIDTTTAMIARTSEAELDIVTDRPRGAPGDVIPSSTRDGVPVKAIHLPQTGYVAADSVQNFAPFGDTSVNQFSNAVDEQLLTAKRKNAFTLEYLRLGAIKGKILGKNGNLILDTHQLLNSPQQRHAMQLSGSTLVNSKCTQALDLIEDALGGVPWSGTAIALCGRGFHSALTEMKSVRETFLGWQAAAALQGSTGKPFTFGDISWVRYRGKIKGLPMIEDDKAYLIPLGVERLLVNSFSPADYTETVNTLGLPFYSSVERAKHGKGYELEMQSNPLCISTHPSAIIELHQNDLP